MLAFLGPALLLATKVMETINTDKARQLINDVKDIKLKILEEESKGYFSDDPKIETLKKQATILIEAATAEFTLNAGK